MEMIVQPEAAEGLILCLSDTMLRFRERCEAMMALHKARMDELEEVRLQYLTLCRRAIEFCDNVRTVVARLQAQCDYWADEMERILNTVIVVTCIDDDGQEQSYETYDKAAYAAAQREWETASRRLDIAMEGLALAKARQNELEDACISIRGDHDVLAELDEQCISLARNAEGALASRGRQLCATRDLIDAYTQCRPFL